MVMVALVVGGDGVMVSCVGVVVRGGGGGGR